MANRPLIIGHRGASAVAPENTICAFKAAVAAGADGVEFDVQLSRDRIPVVIHDHTLHRTAGIDSSVADLLCHELERTDVGSWFARKQRLATNEFAEATIPTLLSLFQLFDSSEATLYLEMKCTPDQRTELVNACSRAINESSLKQRVVVESFDLAAIELMKKTDETIRTAALFEPSLTTLPVISTSHLINAAAAVHADEVALHHKLARPRVVNQLKRNGFKVVVWTVDDPRWIQRAQSMGVDALITNDPARMLASYSTKVAD